MVKRVCKCPYCTKPMIFCSYIDEGFKGAVTGTFHVIAHFRCDNEECVFLKRTTKEK